MRVLTAPLVAAVVAALLGGTACSGASQPQPTATPSASRPAARPTAGPAVAENARPGTGAWRLAKRGPLSAIEGFADRTSVPPGRPFRLYVSTAARGFSAAAYRIGWYGGRQGRLVWRSGHLAGHRQARARTSAHLHTVTAPWRPSLTVPTTGWPEGDYLVKLTADSGYQSYVPMTVRSTSTRGKVVLLNSVATWQAYNMWGGYDLYTGPHGFADRSRAVSFDRPYDRAGIARFMSFERPAVVLAERLGLRLAYLTDTDLAARPGVLAGARALITLGHGEYWSGSMRTAATRARDAGTNLAFLGANAVNRHVRFGSSALGPMRGSSATSRRRRTRTRGGNPPTRPRTGGCRLTRVRRVHCSACCTTASRRTRRTSSPIRATGCSPAPASGTAPASPGWWDPRPTGST